MAQNDSTWEPERDGGPEKALPSNKRNLSRFY